MKRITIHLTTKDRHSELYGCLISLRNQKFKDWDLILLDESKTPITQCYFLNYIINRIKLDGHKVKLIRNDMSQGVCWARNKLIEEDSYGNPLSFRCDDDVILEKDYIGKLLEVIDKGFDMSSGCIPLLGQPELIRENKFVKPMICLHKLDNEGNIIVRNDDLGFCYLEKEILPCMQFRTNVLAKSKIFKEIKYPSVLTQTGFREELWISFQAIIRGYKIGAHTGAICFHLSTPSGGVRPNDPNQYVQNVQLDEETTNKWVKEQYKKYGNFLEKYYDKFM